MVVTQGGGRREMVLCNYQDGCITETLWRLCNRTESHIKCLADFDVFCQIWMIGKCTWGLLASWAPEFLIWSAPLFTVSGLQTVYKVVPRFTNVYKAKCQAAVIESICQLDPRWLRQSGQFGIKRVGRRINCRWMAGTRGAITSGE